jgi:hypothetical protein
MIANAVGICYEKRVETDITGTLGLVSKKPERYIVPVVVSEFRISFEVRLKTHNGS